FILDVVAVGFPLVTEAAVAVLLPDEEGRSVGGLGGYDVLGLSGGEGAAPMAAQPVQPFFVHFIVGPDDPPAGNGHLKVVVAVLGLKLNVPDGDAVVAVPLHLDVVGVWLGDRRVVQRDGEGLVPRDLARGGGGLARLDHLDRGGGRGGLRCGGLGHGRRILGRAGGQNAGSQDGGQCDGGQVFHQRFSFQVSYLYCNRRAGWTPASFSCIFRAGMLQ